MEMASIDCVSYSDGMDDDDDDGGASHLPRPILVKPFTAAVTVVKVVVVSVGVGWQGRGAGDGAVVGGQDLPPSMSRNPTRRHLTSAWLLLDALVSVPLKVITALKSPGIYMSNGYLKISCNSGLNQMHSEGGLIGLAAIIVGSYSAFGANCASCGFLLPRPRQ
ncbi:hypothetical protein GUJ93_ZPchr0012g21774 [Zizania palustris]|uniref:Uncharacterized protein n=1 Tax=Zizania palustris TaxID=103762 RepID=A0A8J5WUE7_ZIZPA|nr:hypothetical protein GUJ93_ZPchr0012g21774 [Zizania palustris]